MKLEKKLSKGLSLIEVLATVAILAILILISIRIFTKQIAKGNDSRRKADLDRIKIAIEEYEKDNNCYPDPELMDNCGWDETIPIHPYLSNVPCDPISNEPYPYETDGLTCSRWFRLYSLLQNINDVSILPGIGPENSYNYYVSSQNAPKLVGSSTGTSAPTASPAFEQIPIYGCKNGSCQQIFYSSGGSPECQPSYDSSNCYNQCGSPANPASECI